MARDYTQAFYNGLVNAMNDVRHKVVEEGYFGWGNGRSVTDDVPPQPAIKDTAPQAIEHQTSPTISAAPVHEDKNPVNSQVSHGVNRPNEEAGWYHGEPALRNGDTQNSEMTPRNGWALGQDAFETRATAEPRTRAEPIFQEVPQPPPRDAPPVVRPLTDDEQRRISLGEFLTNSIEEKRDASREANPYLNTEPAMPTTPTQDDWGAMWGYADTPMPETNYDTASYARDDDWRECDIGRPNNSDVYGQEPENNIER